MFNKLTSWLDDFIMKHHKCEKNMEIYSMTWETFSGIRIMTYIEYKCSVCGKSRE